MLSLIYLQSSAWVAPEKLKEGRRVPLLKAAHGGRESAHAHQRANPMSWHAAEMRELLMS